MSPSPTTSTLTMEFGHELETERHAWLRRRFLWFCGVMFAVSLIKILVSVFASDVLSVRLQLLIWALGFVSLVTYAIAYRYVARHPKPTIPPLKIASMTVLGLGAISLMTEPLVRHFAERDMYLLRESELVRMGTTPEVFKLEIEEPEESAPTKGAQESEDPGASSDPLPTKGGASSNAKDAAAKGTGRSRVPPPRRRDVRDAIRTGISGLNVIFASHFVACVFLPWTGRESMRPVWPLLILNTAMTSGVALWKSMTTTNGALQTILWLTLAFVAASVFTPLPGLAVCWWRHSRFRKRATFDVLRDRYSALKHELTSARQIHESLFPTAIETGECLFRYEYEPMRQIGGDYLHVFAGPEKGPGERALSLILVDVTGHGIPAALTVNRLHGELARIFAENPGVAPGDVLKLLNSYVHLTLATHSVYVTAICLRACAKSDTLEYASGGHPPAFLRSVDGTIERLDSTAFVLGVAAGSDFQPEPRRVRFGPGDTLVAYTDGATEARDDHGRYFGIEGIQRVLAVGRPDDARGWPKTLRDAVEGYREGPTMDDVLVIEMRRPLGRVVQA